MRHYEGKDHPVIWVHSERIKDRVLIHVEDNGPGIPLEHRSKIFRAFERLNPDKCEGLGLGLSISKKII